MVIAALLLIAADPVRLPPVDQCRGDAEFEAMRSRLQDVVEAKDLDGLLALMSDDVRVTFGGRFGREGFRHWWTTASGQQGKLWQELTAATSLGCAAAKDGEGAEYRAMPAMFVTSGGLDGFTTWVSLPGARLRSRASTAAQVRMRLPAWTVLEEAEHDGGDWVQVRTPKGRRGYVSVDEARSIIDYRLVFGRQQGGWRITAFVAGD